MLVSNEKKRGKGVKKIYVQTRMNTGRETNQAAINTWGERGEGGVLATVSLHSFCCNSNIWLISLQS